ncbi:hypothetical protein [Actinomarinicola tropica]|uniref:Uncharacterized protein n=1 Tax=Actinomarinicola tropica TaxID=2789776 RepID=A0A5Q2RJX5_9ACTN|nr:hypothetical protein [Actinomarinicola tropica]QGG94150.1 hypothetical protein GH723_02995 [Actinomarinicola tropica]
MIDFGLVVSVIAAVGAPALLATLWAYGDGSSSFLDDVTAPLLAGLAVGRLVTLALDDPSSIGSLSDMFGDPQWRGVLARRRRGRRRGRLAGVSDRDVTDAASGCAGTARVGRICRLRSDVRLS